MVLAYPELLEAESVEVRGKVDVAPELECRMFPDGMMRSEKGAELEVHF
jgi:hypothetical protein